MIDVAWEMDPWLHFDLFLLVYHCFSTVALLLHLEPG
jgi:hypothetical protein